MDYSLPGSSVHEIFQATILEWVAISFSRGSSWLRNRTGSPTLHTLYCLSHWRSCNSHPQTSDKHLVSVGDLATQQLLSWLETASLVSTCKANATAVYWRLIESYSEGHWNDIDEKQKCNLLNALILGQALTSHSLFVLSLFVSN